MIKKTIITNAIVLLSIFSFSQQIPNGDFENWTDTYNAVGWNSFNVDFANIHSNQQTTDFNQGTYAALLKGNSVYETFFPGLVTLGEIDAENLSVSGGIPFTDRPTGISYFFKYLPLGGDTTYMISLLTKWNEVMQQADTVAITGYFTADEYTNYTELNVPFIYNSLETPDTLNVIFLSSGFDGDVESTLYVDDVTLLYGAVISPTICFPASDTTYNQFTTKCITVPNASSYKLDISESNDFANFVSGYEDIDIGTDTFAFVNVPTGLYFYRKRVNYGTETSINSNTIAVPMPTLNFEATDATSVSFIANWQPANNATNYFIDVATDANFTNIISGYDNLLLGNVTTYLIDNLNSETEYFYRIRVEYGTYLSKNSNIISVNTNVGIEDVVFNNVKVYSNNSEIIILCDIKFDNIQVFDIKGELISDNEGLKVLRVNKKGLYIVKIRFNNFVVIKKVVVK